MFRVLFTILCLVSAASAQRAARNEPAPAAQKEVDKTALGALAQLPKDVAGQVARIEGPEGRPFPERWYVLVHDAAQPRGLREFVVAEGKLAGGRTLSQFADSITPEEVVGAANVKINSDEAAGIAAQFAMHNEVQIGTIHYELLKATVPPAPVWRLTCSGRGGEPLGTIVVHADKGSLLSYSGFAKSPMEVDAEAASETEKPADARTTATQKKPAASSGNTASKPAKRTASSSTRTTSAPRPAPRARPVDRPPPPRQGPIDRAGSVFRRIFRD